MISRLLNRDSLSRLPAFWTRTVMVFMGAMMLSFMAYAQPMSGSYTVCAGGSCDYSTIGGAVSDLVSNGVSGAVTINIAAGTYSEAINITAISGASSTNTITFKGAGRNSTIITQSTTGETFRIYYSDYINVEDLRIENTYSSTRYGLYIYYSNYANVNNVDVVMSGSGTIYGMYLYRSDNCTLRNSSVDIPHYGASGFSTAYGIRHYYCSNNLIEANSFEGGYYGMYIYGSSSYAYKNNTFKDNYIKGTGYYPMYIRYNYSNTYDGNIIDTQSVNVTYHYGMYIYYDGNATVKNNIIRNGYYGIRFYYPNRYGNSSDVVQIYNNIVTGHDQYGYYGLYFYATSSSDRNLKVYHNTVYLKGSGGYAIDFYNSSGSGHEIKNNLFYRTSGSGMDIYNGSNVSMDGNAWIVPAGNMGYYNNNNLGTYADYVSAAATNGNGQNSSDGPVTFVSTTPPYDLHLDQSSPAPSGVNVGIDKDIDGDSRCLIFPTVGVDENNYGKGAFKAKFFVPSIVYDQAPVVFYNFAKPEEPKLHRWYVDGVYVTDSVHLETALSGSSHVISLVTVGCAGTDSTWQTVTITSPPVVPVSDFIANQNIFPQGGEVRFSDLSTYGPSKWKWEITPEKTYVNGVLVNRYKYLYGTTDSSKNPVVQFNSAGKYEVCMTATNTKGDGNKECKVDYIEVTPQINMGDVEETNAAQGTLFDSGGPLGEALTGGKTELIINACASDVYLVIDEFDMMCGYNYLRIYDGTEENDSFALHPCTTNTGSNNTTGLTGGTGYPYCNGNNSCMPELSGTPNADTFHATSGKMLIVQEINYPYGPYGYTPGFKARWWSTPKTFTPPVASFEVDTTVCQNGLLTFKNTTSGEDVKYNWDLDGDMNTFEAQDDDETQWLFPIAGKQTVTLIAQNCGGVDTFQQVIDVFVPNKPTITFTTSNTNPTPADVVFINSDISECVDDYEWTFTRSSGSPGTVTFMNGTSKFAENPAVMFSDTGCWDVTLKATNAGGTSTLKKTCFVNVKESYCVPAVATMSKDVGISEVVIMASADSSDLMRNPSDQAVKDYTNFANNPNLSTGLEIGVTYLVQVNRTSNANAVTRNIWIDWNLDGDFNDPQEAVAVETNAKTLSWTASVTVPIIAKEGASVMRIAINTGQFSNEVCGQNRFGEYEDYRVVISNDRTAPVITLYGEDGASEVESGDTIVIEQGRMFSEWGFKAVDNLDGDITSNVTSDTMALPNGPSGTTLNTFVVRDYMISYYAQDATGNKGEATRIIKVIPDTTAPELMVGGTDTIRHDVDDAANFQMPQVISVNDIVDGIQVNMETEIYNDGVLVTSLDPAMVDTYTVVFRATDAAGNMTEVTRIVIGEDLVAPTVTLIGANPVDHPVGTPYTDEYVTFADNYWGTDRLEDYLTVVNNVNENVLGTYTVEYTLYDPVGNGPATAVRTVNVVDREAPVASVEAEDTIMVEVMTKFEFPDVSYSDNYWNAEDLMIEWAGTLIPTIDNGVLTEIGTFTLEFVVTDSSNNVTTIEKVVVVEDLTAPELMLLGENAITVCRWEDYNDSGYTMMDNYWAAEDITVEMEGSFVDNNETDLPGLYTLRYKAEDASGNIGYSPYRSILVLSENEYPCYLNSIDDAASLEKMVSIYPNPSTGNFTVKVGLQSQQQLRISVMNLLGEELTVVENGQVLSDVYNVDLSSQASGVYLLKVQADDYSFTKRLVIQK